MNNSGLTCFITIVQYWGIKMNNETIQHLTNTANKNFDEEKILGMGKYLNLKCKLIKSKKLNNIDKLNIPIIAKMKDNNFVIITKNKNHIMISNTETKETKLIELKEFYENWGGIAIIISKKGKENRKIKFGFKWFLPTIYKFKGQLISVLVAALIIQLLGLLSPMMTQIVVDKVLVHFSKSTLYVLTVGLAISYIFELVLNLTKNYVFTHTTNRIDVVLSDRLFKHLFALPLKYFESRRVGDTIARVRELENIRSFLTGTPLSSLIDLFFVIIYIVVLFIYSTKLSLVVLFSLPIFAILSLVITPMFKKSLDEKYNSGADAQAFLVESVSAVQTVKSFALEPKLEEKWGNLQAEYVKASYKTSMIANVANNLSRFIQKNFDLLILFLGALEVMDGNFTVGQLVAFRMLASRVSEPILRFVQLWQEYQQASLSVKRIGDIFNAKRENFVKNTVSMPNIEGRIVFDHVGFRYRIDTPLVIDDMSFRINEGEVIGIVGKSGSGKSTVSKLLQRMYIPEKGKVLIDGYDISMVDTAWLRGQIGIVLQENFVFTGSIAYNISIHCPEASMEQIIKASKIAGAHEFISEMQNGYDTIIGEKGVGLSGGQKQRIAIARAIVNNPRILIFDEATSALDYESESIIQNNIEDICRGRTVIIIAHRISTLKNTDRIMTIDRGRVVEFDTHENLMEEKGIYCKLYNMQLRGDING